MKCNFWAAVVAVLVSLLPLALVLTSVAEPWGKLKYSFGVLLIGSLIYYVGDKL